MEGSETMKLIWKKIEEFPKYEASNFGQIRNRTTKNLIKPRLAGQGKYFAVALRKEGKTYQRYIHRLVAQVFIPNPNNKYSVNHIDGNRYENKITNLEWASGTEQNNHAYSIGLKSAGEKCNLSKLTEKEVLMIRSLPKELTHTEIAKIYKVSVGSISMIRRNITWKHLKEI